MSATIPKSMQAVLLEQPGGAPIVGQLPTPVPGPGQVLVRMAATPINPSDLGFLQGSYGFQKPFPVVPGFEGSGTVVAAGSGLLPHLLFGRRVACSAAAGGAWAEYLVTPATTCFPLVTKLSQEQAATLIINPLTALAFLDIARQDKHAAVVHNAAASALGRMILRLGQQQHIPIIHIVRRPEQVELLHTLGAEHVLSNRDSDFVDRLHTLAVQLKATLILDPVGGEQTQQLLTAAPAGSTVVLYGSLSGDRIEVTSQASRRGNTDVTGFFLPNWIAQKNVRQILQDGWRVQRFAATIFQTTIQKRFPLAEVQPAIELYRTNPTAGKVLLVTDPDQVAIE
jgi:NADPH:quinone reductase